MKKRAKANAIKKVSRDKGHSYLSVPKDFDGWVDASKYVPADYDLCLLKIEGKSIRPGWISGLNWNGLRVEDKDKVLFWKRKKEHVT